MDEESHTDWEADMLGPSPEIGLPLGVLIGVLSGVIGDLLIRVIRQGIALKDIPKVIGEFVAIPTFWFGGSWLTGKMLESVATANIVQSYILALAVTFVLIIVYPLVRLVIWQGQIEAAGGGSKPDG